MSDETAVELDAVSLCYRLAKQRVFSFKSYLIHLVQGSLTYDELWALQDANIRITRGESVGIIGRNGAGKSTLVKVVARVLKPQKGRTTVRGVVSPILELGLGFDNELTGRENIYLNALLLGRKNSEIDPVVEDIITFSGIRDFIDSPMRMYSTGMVMRLGFAVATAWTPDILILDEVLAVGDVRFVARCLERIERFKREGTTLIMVSHAPETIRDHCERCIWLEHGRVREDGPSSQILDLYLEEMTRDEPSMDQTIHGVV